MQKPSIVILDSYPANPGDLSWDPVAAHGDLTVYEHCPDDPAEVIRRAGCADIILTNKVRFTDELMAALPKLKLIAVQATGYNIIDTAAAKKRGIVVCNVPGYSTNSVAQLTFSFILDFFTGVGEQSEAVQKGDWCNAPDFMFYPRKIQELAGKTLGIFGFGTIGQKVGKIGADFGMRVIYHSRTPKTADFAEFVSLEKLFAESDVLTLHAPMTPETALVVNQERLALMKKTAYLINTARGGLVDDAALAEALNRGRISGAGIDVLTQEPPPEDHPLLHAKNCRITPHVGWASLEARKRLIDILGEEIKAFLAGKPINQVNR